MRDIDAITNKQQLIDVEINYLEQLVRYIDDILSASYMRPGVPQRIALASLAKATEATQALLLLAKHQYYRELHSHTRVVIELRTRLGWLLRDDGNRDKKLDTYLHNVLRDKRRLQEAVVSSGLPPEDQARAEEDLEALRKAETDSEAQLNQKYGSVTLYHKVTLLKMFQDLDAEKVYNTAYRYTSYFEHSEGAILDQYMLADGDVETIEEISFSPIHDDGMAHHNIWMTYSNLQEILGMTMSLYKQLPWPEFHDTMKSHREALHQLRDKMAVVRER